jgi:predicted outer membrane repeat protein
LASALAMGGIVTFKCGGTQNAPTTILLTSPKTIAAKTVIDGGLSVVLSGGGSTRIFVTQGDVDFTVQNITLAHASVTGPRGNGPSSANSGAAIYRQSNAKLTVINSTFQDNHSTDTGADIGGGAIYSYGGDTVITGSTFDGNSGAGGGAIGNLRSNLTIVDSTFVNNQAKDTNGGAIALDGQNMDHGKVFTMCGVIAKNNHAKLEAGAVYRYGYPGESTTIDSVTFDGNSADDMAGGLGGALYHHTDTVGAMPLTLTNSTISNNTAGRGAGGMFFFNSPVSLTNVTIANNKALTSLGGGIAANDVPGTLLNCTIAGNHADHPDSFGGAIIGGSKLTLLNTIISGNTAGNAYNPVNCTNTGKGDHDIQFPATETSGQKDNPCAPGIMFADPLLGPLQDNGGPTATMALGAGSPAIGAGTACPNLDQRGKPRSGSCDLGAVEHDP